MIIAIDGPAASGKGTLAKHLAAHFGLRHLDTGLLYRAVAKSLIDAGISVHDEARAISAAHSLDAAQLDEATLKARGMAEPASIVSAMPGVRAALVDLQRSFAATAPGAVLDGRDIGTVICPQAEVKIFVDAAPEVRARRRVAALAQLGVAVNEADVLADIQRRDERDMTRAVAPLKPAADSHVLDTTQLDIDGAVRAAIAIVERSRAGVRTAVRD
jgi:cytidylate kinase